jgi:hypothetical protein
MMNVSLTHWQARMILEALRELETKWSCANQCAGDEDQPAEYANDLIELAIVKDELTEQAVKAFGPSVTTFDRSLV